MSNDTTPQVPAEQPKPGLPEFDPNAPAAPLAAADDTQTLPSSATTELPVTPPTTRYAYAAAPGTATTPEPAASAASAAPVAGPSVPLSPTGLPGREKATQGDGVRWSAKKTAVTAGLAIVLASAGAIGAAAAVPAGSTGGDTGLRGPGGRTFQFPGGQQNQNGAPGGGMGGIDPNQLSQLDPQDLLQQLNQGIDPFSGGSDGSGGSGQGDTGSSTGGTKTT